LRQGQFQPGDPRINRGGRPKSKPITEAIQKELRAKAHGGKLTNLQLMVKALVDTAKLYGTSESVAAAKLILSYVEGLPVQSIELDIRQEAERIAAEHGVDPSRLISLADELKKRKAG
jgi:hypothetical protein